jgi:ATP-dependent DNA ligase
MEAWLKPMLCASADEVPESSDWAIEGKLDGWRAVAHVNGDVRLFGGRNGSPYTGKLPYVEDELARLLPADSAVDGELVGTEGWGDVQGVMTRGSGPHVPTKAIPALAYVVFDVVRLDGEDLRAKPWGERREKLEQALAGAVEHVRISPTGDSSARLHDEFVALGLEGSVCKRKDSRYVNGRSPLWVKVKPVETIEARITGFKPGTKGSAFDGLVGAIEFQMPSGAQSRCSGFDMRTRRALTENPDVFIGRTIEVAHQGLSADGKPRFPRFARFRPDRDGLTPRERQIQEAIIDTAEPKRTRAQQVAAATRPATRRMRNYRAMKDDKLMRVMRELETQGEAYQRCVESGSGEPDADLAVVQGLAQERGLL